MSYARPRRITAPVLACALLFGALTLALSPRIAWADTASPEIAAAEYAEDDAASPRADLWVDMLEQQQRRQQSQTRWMQGSLSGAFAHIFALTLWLEPFASPQANWMTGAALLPFSAGMVAGLASRPLGARLAGLGIALGAGLMAGAFAYEQRAHAAEEERAGWAGVSTLFAGTALLSLTYALLPQFPSKRDYEHYRSRPVPGMFRF